MARTFLYLVTPICSDLWDLAPGVWIFLCPPSHHSTVAPLYASPLAYWICLYICSQYLNYQQLLLSGFICLEVTTGVVGGAKYTHSLSLLFYILYLKGTSIRKGIFHGLKSAPMKAALETCELYVNLSLLSLSEVESSFSFFSLGVCTAPHNPSLACRVKLSFHSGKGLMKILHREVLRA